MSWLWRTIARTALLLFASGAIAAAALGFVGLPSPRHMVRQNEIARFAPDLRRGVVQLGGETMLLVLVAFVGRRWLRIRL
jgi:hypothetical protein